MKDAAAIAAQLVDLRNVGMHKVVKMTIHVPEEYALRLTEIFGWPTMVNPVPVAIARLQEGGDAAARTVETPPAPVAAQLPGRAKSFDEMKPAQQAGILCNDPVFRRFLAEYYEYQDIETPDAAANVIYELCHVTSRADIEKSDWSRDRWASMVADYRAWKFAPQVVG